MPLASMMPAFASRNPGVGARAKSYFGDITFCDCKI